MPKIKLSTTALPDIDELPPTMRPHQIAQHHGEHGTVAGARRLCR